MISDELLERIANSRADADYDVAEGRASEAFVALTVEDCDEIVAFLNKVGPALLRSTDPEAHSLFDQTCGLAGAFEKEDD